MTRMKYAVHVLLGMVALSGSLAAQNVAEDVLKGKEIQGIEFKNYVGPHKIIESRQAIQGIGTELGRQMKVPGATHTELTQKYSVLRIHDPSSDKLSVDLLILGPDAGVDNIRNLNWIVSAYLQQVFGYSQTDGDLLSDFVTKYNAFYRGKMDYIKATFIPAVADNVTAENAGIALSYTDWAGKTRLMIPLRDSLSKGLGGSINTEEISNKDVIKDATQPVALDERKKLADLKEAEIVQEQKAIVQAESKTVPSTPGTTPGSPTVTPGANALQTTTTTTPKTATSTAATATTTTTSTTTPPVTPPGPTPPATLPLAQAKQQLAARDQALQTERQNIVQQETQKAATPTPTPAAAVKPASTVGFVKINPASKTGQVWLIDPVANKVWKKSELNTVRQVQAPAFGPGLLVVAGDTKVDNGAVRLVLLSKDDGSVLLTGADDVSPDTPLIISGNQVLALTKTNKGTWVLGSFDTNLKSLVKGTDDLTALTAVVPTPSGVLVQLAVGPVILLEAATLKKISTTGE